MKTLPSLMYLSDSEREALKPAERYAAYVGCPKKYLYLADKDYAVAESYKIHPFKSLQLKKLDGAPVTLEAGAQLNNCDEVVSDLLAEGSSVTVINAHPDLSEGYLFFWHLVGHFSSSKLQKPIDNRHASFSFIGNFKLENDNYYPSSCLGFGPVLDEMSDYQVTHYVDLLMRFEDCHRVILMSSTDVTGTLQRLRLVPDKIKYFFNLSGKPDAPSAVKKAPRKRKIEVI